MKKLTSLFFVLLALQSFSQSNWTLSGGNIFNNNSGLVGIGEVTPTAKLEIKTRLLDYDYFVVPGQPFNCLSDPTGLKIIGVKWTGTTPTGSSCSITTLPNLFEASIQTGSATVPAGSGGTAPYYYAPIRKFTINSDGKVGIGDNLDPTQDLDVAGSIRMRTGAAAGLVATSSADGTMSWQPASSISAYWKPTSGASPGTGHIMNKDNGEVHIGNVEGVFFLDPYLGASHYTFLAKTGDVGLIFGPTSEGGISQNEPGLVIAARNPNNSSKNGLRIDWNGNVMIGSNNSNINTNANNTFKLAVNGSIIAELIRVKIEYTWPDFVFLENHKMLTLPELENYIEENGHLPNVPTATEVKEEGIDLGEMNRILLQKIEELTLYVIELEKRINGK